MKILFLTLYPSYQPSTRFRVMQFLPYLAKGHVWKVRSTMPERLFRRFYGSRKRLGRLVFHLTEFFCRLFGILSAFRYDAVFIQKAFGTINYRFFDFLLFAARKPIVYDFDDAVTIDTVSQLTKFPWCVIDDPNQNLRLMRRARKIIVGNRILRKDLNGLNLDAVVIPTPVDTDYFRADPGRYGGKERLELLWSGNRSGHVLFNLCAQAIRRLSQKYSFRMNVLSDIRSESLDRFFEGVSYRFIRWDYDSEKDAFASADIGIMPVMDTLWNRRKCAFKALMYMASGIPVVASPVGIVGDIIRDGENGFLADSDEEWHEKLELLVKDSDLRKSMGLKGRRTVEEDFSLSKWGPCWDEAIRVN